MNFNIIKCYVCQEYQDSSSVAPVQPLHNPDTDGTLLINKLKLVVPIKFQDIDNPEHIVCTSCISHLQISYKFIQRIQEVHSNRFYDEKIETSDDVDPLAVETCVKEVEYSKDIKLECELCWKVFSKRWELRKHKKRVHEEEKSQNLCVICEKTFKRLHHLKEHLKIHVEPKLHECQYCGKAFHKSHSKTRHERTHKKSDSIPIKNDPFLCNICGKEFSYKNNASRHLRTHFDEKTYQCNVCLKKFTQSSHVITHLKSYCKGVKIN